MRYNLIQLIYQHMEMPPDGAEISATGTEMKKYPEMRKYDVIVCGAGPGGVGAAIGAAKTGRKVLLVDRNSGPGGVAVYCGCPVFSGLDASKPATQGGVVSEFVDAMRNHASFIGTHALSSSEFDIGLTMNRMLCRAGAERLFYATVTGADTENGRIRSITVFSCGQLLTFDAEAFVDATGDAVLADFAGAELLAGSPEETMTKTLLFRVANVESFDKQLLLKQFPNLDFPYAHQDRFMGVPVCDGKEILLNLTAVSGNALNPFDMTRMDTELREQIPVILDWARKKLPGFAGCRLSAVAPSTGVRGSRNIVAREMITMKDLDSNTPVTEPVAMGKRSYGEHYIHTFCSPWQKQNPGYRAIPYGALLPRGVENLAVAGRCIGVEPCACSAIRLMSVCMAVGEAAGIAAALKFPEYETLKQELRVQRGSGNVK